MPRSHYTLTVEVVSDSNISDSIHLIRQALESTPSLDVLKVEKAKKPEPKPQKEKNGGRREGGKEAAK